MRGPSFMVITGYNKDGLPLKARTSNRCIASEEVNLSVNLEIKNGVGKLQRNESFLKQYIISLSRKFTIYMSL